MRSSQIFKRGCVGDVQTKLVESAVGLVCFQFVQGAKRYMTTHLIWHMKLASYESVRNKARGFSKSVF